MKHFMYTRAHFIKKHHGILTILQLLPACSFFSKAATENNDVYRYNFSLELFLNKNRLLFCVVLYLYVPYEANTCNHGTDYEAYCHTDDRNDNFQQKSNCMRIVKMDENEICEYQKILLIH